MQQLWPGYQHAWGAPETAEAAAPASVPPGCTEGFVCLSRRVFVIPENATAMQIVSELNDVHELGVSERSLLMLSPLGWNDEEAFMVEVNKALRVKGGKTGPKFWKGVREALMRQCAMQDVVLVLSGKGTAEQHTSALLKNVFEAAETKAAADQLVGLKSGKVIALLAGWDVDDVRAWPFVAEDPVADVRESEWHREWARTHDPDGLAQYYSQAQRQAPPRQVPPRQRQSYVPPQQRVPYRPAGYVDARDFDAHVPQSPHVQHPHMPPQHGPQRRHYVWLRP